METILYLRVNRDVFHFFLQSVYALFLLWTNLDVLTIIIRKKNSLSHFNSIKNRTFQEISSTRHHTTINKLANFTLCWIITCTCHNAASYCCISRWKTRQSECIVHLYTYNVYVLNKSLKKSHKKQIPEINKTSNRTWSQTQSNPS